jgi:hypothetical protein
MAFFSWLKYLYYMIQNKTFLLSLTVLLVLSILLTIGTFFPSAAPSKPLLLVTSPPSAELTRTVSQNAATVSARNSNSQEKVGTLFAARMAQWEVTPMPEADQIEQELEAMLTDENAAAIAQELPTKFLKTYLGLKVQERWASVDRQAAVHWLASQPNPTAYQVNAVIDNWVVQDKESLLGYINRLPAGEWRDKVLASAGEDALNNQDPDTAFSLVRSMPPGDKQTGLMEKAIFAWSQWNPQASVEQINQLPDPDLQEKLVLDVAFGYATTDPAPAANWVIQSFDQGEFLDRGLQGVIGIWVDQHKATDAAAWVASLPSGATQQNALKSLIDVWAKDNPQEVRNWVNNLPEGDFHTQAEANLAKTNSL